MITIFNRRELYVTYDMKAQASVREVLASNGIDYSIKTINRMNASSVSGGERGRMGTYGQDASAMCEYRIYVRKADCEKATKLIMEQADYEEVKNE